MLELVIFISVDPDMKAWNLKISVRKGNNNILNLPHAELSGAETVFCTETKQLIYWEIRVVESQIKGSRSYVVTQRHRV